MDEKTDYSLVQDQSSLRKKVTFGVLLFVSIFAIGLGAGVIVQEVSHNNIEGHNSQLTVTGDVNSCYGVHLMANGASIGDSSVCPGAKKTQFLVKSIPTAVKFDIPASQCFANVVYATNQTLEGFKGPTSITIKSAHLAAKLGDNSTATACATGYSFTKATTFSLDLVALKGVNGSLPSDNATILSSLSV
ncbi:hypothetical protein SPRG_04720 [Saprolegnia parasitica CBS 223.65]|uniref:Uncharacterized protein n=1 Tax=Saprolegnia parasitica (strain CBS 223.65) TaxID=695850 RepID=A0A067CJB4_SAPPC|nr:hypothetical protein SPRG_04720 [Saprolegnia parasitica CBS 223.65]KDO30819.1 hypothetical protein SPRG_04720 [Saprolegnia parasitica CBS 223.65]|eukprot:XP_012198516.1 hypothetical protein SPRG_04720 [Saprolegnia parasitica CBS 223.65]